MPLSKQNTFNTEIYTLTKQSKPTTSETLTFIKLDTPTANRDRLWSVPEEEILLKDLREWVSK